MRTYRCVSERLRGTTPETLLTVVAEVWHIVPVGYREGDGVFAPILCSDEEGIVAPGPTEVRAATCPQCIAATRATGRARARATA